MYYASGYYNFRMRRLHCYPNDSRYTFMDFVYMDLFVEYLKLLPKNMFVAVYGFVFTLYTSFIDYSNPSIYVASINVVSIYVVKFF